MLPWVVHCCAPRSLVRSTEAARRPVSIVYRLEAVLESCLGRCYVPEREDLHNLLLLSLKRAIRWLTLKTRKLVKLTDHHQHNTCASPKPVFGRHDTNSHAYFSNIKVTDIKKKITMLTSG